MVEGILSGLVASMLLMLESYGFWVIFLGVFFLGENAALAAFILSAQGYFPWPAVFLLACLGSLSSDIFWYFTSTKLLKRVYEKKFLQENQTEQKMFLLRMADKHTFWFLTFIKFLVGMRLFLTIYILLKKHIGFIRYLLINVVGTILFIGVLFPVGWYLGKGLESAFFIEKGIKGLLSTVIAVIILANIVPRIFAWLVKKYATATKEKID